MIDSVVLRRGGRVIFEKPGRDEVGQGSPQVASEIEIAVDQHFGIRIVQGQTWTTISFREAGEWSKPEDTRKLIRAALKG
jgi:hypothetical protein